MTVTEREFLIKGRRIAARCWHDASLPPLLALHGWQDNAATFDHLAPLLPGFHIVAMDFAGHGFSDWRADGVRYHTLDHVDDVFGVVNALGWESFRLVGHSMGAGIGVLLAGAMPERVSQLALLDGLGPYPGEPEEAPSILRDALLEWSEYFPREERVFDSVESAVIARRRGFTPLSHEAAATLCTRSLRAVEGGFSWTTDRRVRQHSSLRVSETQVRAFLSAIESEVLLLRAERAFPGAEEMFAARWTAVQRGRVEVLPGGHHLHLDECPEQVAELLADFFAKKQ
ncbi:MAG: alpha/beta hydrolase [Pedobacter sp.]|nr:alpha/beta hydrolase [Pedobacter sp.]